MVRVIAGKAKGTKLEVPAELTRPVTDRIKTTIFDLLREYLPGAAVLDLYAGSGAYGIEALSRGARHAAFVDASRDAADIIKRNLVKCKFGEGEWNVITGKLPNVIDSAGFLGSEEFDIVFCDPPFTTITLEDLSPLFQKLSGRLWVLRLPSQPAIDLQKLSGVLTQNNLQIAHQETIGLSQLFFLHQMSSSD